MSDDDRTLLLDAANADGPAVRAAWTALLRRRVEEVRTGAVATLSLADVRSLVAARGARRRR